MSFQYLIEKVHGTEFCLEPFKHLEIKDFLSPEHFECITSSPEISIPPAKSDQELIDLLLAAGYEAIYFPGTTQDVNQYLRWHADGGSTRTKTRVKASA